MAQVVKPHVAKASLAEERLESVGDVLGIHRRATHRWEDQVPLDPGAASSFALFYYVKLRLGVHQTFTAKVHQFAA